MRKTLSICGCVWALALPLLAQSNDDDKTLRVFIFAGQSNMVGSDSKVKDIKRFPPYIGLEAPQENVLFTYCIGRQNKMRSDGWVALQRARSADTSRRPSPSSRLRPEAHTWVVTGILMSPSVSRCIPWH